MGGLVPAHWWVELGLVPLAGRTVFSKQLCADGWGCVPTLLVVWPEASQHWSLQVLGGGQVLVRKWQPLGGLTPVSTPQKCCCQCLCPCSEPQPPPTFTGDPLIPAGRSGPGSYEVTAFSLVPGVHETLCTPGVEFLFPSVLWNSCNQTPLAFKARFSGGSSFCCQTPRLGRRPWDSELSLLWENFVI